MSVLDVALWGIIICTPWWGVWAYCSRGRAEVGHRALLTTAWVWMLAGMAVPCLQGSTLASLCGCIQGFPLLQSFPLRMVGPSSVMAAWGLAASGAALWWVFTDGRRASFSELCLVAVIPFVWLCDHLGCLLAAQGLLTGLTAWLVGRDSESYPEEPLCRDEGFGAASASGRPGVDAREQTASRGRASPCLSLMRRWWFSNAWADALLVISGLMGAIELGNLSISTWVESERVEWLESSPERGVLVGLLVWLGLWGRLQLIPFPGLRDSGRSWSVQTNMLMWWIAPLPLAVKWWSWGSVWWSAVPVLRSLIGEWSLWAACLSLWCAVASATGRTALLWLGSTSFCLASSLAAAHPLQEIVGGCYFSLLAMTWLGMWFEKPETCAVQSHSKKIIRIWIVGTLAVIASGGAWWAYVRGNSRPIPLFQGEEKPTLKDGLSPWRPSRDLPVLTAVVACLTGLQCVKLALQAPEHTVGRRGHRADGIILVSLAIIGHQVLSSARVQEMLGAPFSAWLVTGGLAGCGASLVPHSFQTYLSRVLAPLIMVAQQQFLLPELGYSLVQRPLRGVAQLCGHMERLLHDRGPNRFLKDLLQNAVHQLCDVQITADYAILSLIMIVTALVITMMWLAG